MSVISVNGPAEHNTITLDGEHRSSFVIPLLSCPEIEPDASFGVALDCIHNPVMQDTLLFPSIRCSSTF